MNLTDDPRLTAYALDEMAAAERVAFERELANDPAAQAEISAIRATAGLLSSGLHDELTTIAATRAGTPGDGSALMPVPADADLSPVTLRRTIARHWTVAAAAAVVVSGIVAVALLTSNQGQRRVALSGDGTIPIAPTRPATVPAVPPATTVDLASGAATQPGRPTLVQAGSGGGGGTHNLGTAPAQHFGFVLDDVQPALPPEKSGVDLPAMTGSTLATSGGSTAGKSTANGALTNGEQRDQIVGSGAQRQAWPPGLEAAPPATVTALPHGLADVAGDYGEVRFRGSAPSLTSGASAEAGVQSNVTAAPGEASAPVAGLVTGGNTNAARVRFYDDAGRRQADVRLERERVSHNDAESYAPIQDNAFLNPTAAPLSTFGVDVDTASFANVRRYLAANQLPPADAVRIEELINYFPTADAPPPATSPTGDVPFAVHTEVGDCPWAPEHRLVRIALKGKVIENEKRPPSNLVFLIDVSGSMDEPNKLPLVQRSLRKLVGQLGENDRVAIVVYAGNSGMVLPSTNASDKTKILDAIDNLKAGGSTNGGEGIELAYKTAEGSFVKNGTNRVILCTDGDFNVGVTDRSALFDLIASKAKDGVFLSVCGFGTGNTKDDTMEGLADKGNGQYAYIDTDREADKVFVGQVGGTLVTIAKDVKLQLEFNPATVKHYRLIGYENRVMAAQDFNNDLKDSGDIGAGHNVVALYEIEPVPHPGDSLVPPDDAAQPALKYQRTTTAPVDTSFIHRDELLTLKLRFKKPDAPLEQGTSELIETVVQEQPVALESESADFRFDASVAAFGMLLRDSPYKGSASWDLVRSLARSGIGTDAGGYRSEFLNMIDQAAQLRR